MRPTFLYAAITLTLGLPITAVEISPRELAAHAPTNRIWWPTYLDLSPRRQNRLNANPYGEQFKYPEEFKTLGLVELKKDI
jgi:catalase (peroxidase I)